MKQEAVKTVVENTPSHAFNPAMIEAQFSDWLDLHVLSPDFVLQALVVVTAFFIGVILRKHTLTAMEEGIEKFKAGDGIKKALHNLSHLTLQFVMLALMFFGSLALAGLTAKTEMLQAAVQLMGAWIVIRLIVQLVGNSLLQNLFAVVIWVITALAMFGVLDETTAALDAAGMNFGTFRISALTVTKGVVALFLLLYAAIVFSGFAERRIQGIKDISPSSRVLISKIVRVLLITFALMIAVAAAGVNLSLLAMLSGGIGLGLGFGLQKVISNLFSGFLLLMDKSIKPGDIIELPGGAFGWVDQMGARYTSIVTRDNKSYLIPNEDFVTQQVVNWSHGNTLVRLEVKFGVDYCHNPHDIKALAEAAAQKPDRVVSDPKPLCHLTEFGDNGLHFVVRFWIRDAHRGVVNMQGAVMMALWDAFQENGVKIPYPHREIYVHEARD